jgi:hypothetical protein
MGLVVVALVTVVAALGMILFAAHKIRPRSLRFKASAARWLSLSLEIEAPERRIVRMIKQDRHSFSSVE